MKDRIIASLKRLSIGEYTICREEYNSVQLFFIKKSLDMKRSENNVIYDVTVFCGFEIDGKPKKGSSQVSLYESMSDPEIDRELSNAYFAAGFVKNPTYELQEAKENTFEVMSSDLNDISLTDAGHIFTKALFEEDTQDDVFLNSAEIFVYERKLNIYNSNGVDAGYVKRYVKGEFVAQCKEPQDVETYKSFRYDNLDTDALKLKVKNTLNQTKTRALASSAPKAGEYRVIIGENYIRDIFEYYTYRSSASAVYAGYSSFKVGENVQSKADEGSEKEITGDKISIVLKATEPFSYEGTPQKDFTLMDEGVLKRFYGGVRFSRYLDIEPTGNYFYLKVKPGSKTLKELKAEPYLQVLNFSDFQMDPYTGHFGGEIRLAILYDGEKEIPVTGGSINGSIMDSQYDLTLSSETQKEENYEGPLAVCFNKVTVAGS